MKTTIDRVFEVTLVIKGLDGIAELVGGVILFFISPASINNAATTFANKHNASSFHHFVADHLLNTTKHLTKSAILFSAIYLVAHGLIKIILVVAVLEEKLWAYPWMIAFLLVFIVYQIYRVVLVKFSISLTLLTVFDIFVTYLTVIEYKKHKLLAAEKHSQTR